MANKDTGWRPKGGVESYGGYEVWEYEVGPHEVNEGEIDGDIVFDPDGSDDSADSTDSAESDDE